jgi:hypothetical protein
MLAYPSGKDAAPKCSCPGVCGGGLAVQKNTQSAAARFHASTGMYETQLGGIYSSTIVK